MGFWQSWSMRSVEAREISVRFRGIPLHYLCSDSWWSSSNGKTMGRGPINAGSIPVGHPYAQVLELVDNTALEAVAVRRRGSNPLLSILLNYWILMTIINLEDHKLPDVNILAGREKGEKLKKLLNLQELESDTITIIVPESIYTITTSFFVGMFGDTVKRLGQEKFLEIYNFVGLDDYIIKTSVRYAANYSS